MATEMANPWRLFVTPLCPKLPHRQIKEYFKQFGDVVEVTTLPNYTGFIYCKDETEAKKIAKLAHKTKFNGRNLIVRVADVQGNCPGKVECEKLGVCWKYNYTRDCSKGAQCLFKHVCKHCVINRSVEEAHAADDSECPSQTEGYTPNEILRQLAEIERSGAPTENRNSILSGDPDTVGGDNVASGWSDDDSQDFESGITQTSGDINKKISNQLNKILLMRTDEATKVDIAQEVKVLMDLKVQYKAATGENWEASAQSQEGETVQDLSGGAHPNSSPQNIPQGYPGQMSMRGCQPSYPSAAQMKPGYSQQQGYHQQHGSSAPYSGDQYGMPGTPRYGPGMPPGASSQSAPLTFDNAYNFAGQELSMQQEFPTQHPYSDNLVGYGDSVAGLQNNPSGRMGGGRSMAGYGDNMGGEIECSLGLNTDMKKFMEEWEEHSKKTQL